MTSENTWSAILILNCVPALTADLRLKLATLIKQKQINKFSNTFPRG